MYILLIYKVICYKMFNEGSIKCEQYTVLRLCMLLQVNFITHC